MKAIILSRVSTEEQKEAGNSLPAQIARIEAYCSRKGFEVIENLSFDESAYKEKRDEFDKILSLIETLRSDKLAICFDKVDRLSRNVFDKRVVVLYEMAVKGQIELHFVSENQIINSQMDAGKKFQFDMSLGLANYYSNAISDNVKRAFEQKRRSGEWTGGPPFGYKSLMLDKSKRLRADMIPDPERAPIVREIFMRYADGTASAKSLAKEFAERGITTQYGNRFSHSHIHHILCNTFYYGEARSNKHNITYPHKYEPLVSKALWLKAKDVREKRNRNPIRTDTKSFLFGGLLSCAICHCAMTAELKKGKYVYYSCTNAKRICTRIYIREEELLKPIKQVFSSIKLTDAQISQIVSSLREHFVYQSKYHKERIQTLRSQYDAQQVRVDKLIDLLMDGAITQQDYERKLTVFKKSQQLIEIELEDLTKADQDHHITAGMILTLAQRAGELFDSSELSEKRRLLKFVLQNPVVNGKNLEFKLRKPFDTIADVKGYPIGLRG